ncbi:MAG TPA: glycosyltransferase [Candidatus Limnocylindria bacterium]|nr:glycosyltransferase [Candidatus Limnocylindria bacterium]
MRRLLVVAYFFPPVGGVGVERTLKHVEHLPTHGWQPVVVAPANSGYRLVDPATEARIPPGTEVHRVRTVEPAHLRRAVGRLVGRGGSRPTAPATTASPEAGTGGLLGRVRDAANAAWGATIPLLFFPDEQVAWLPGAVAAGVAAHQAEPVDAIYSSSPPVSGHLAAGRIARRIGRPWIADFRDPWIGNAFARRLPAPHRAAQRRMERWIVEQADRVVLATAAIRDAFATRYPDREGRLVHLPNGYDLADLGGEPAAPRDDGTFRLIYAGSVYGDRELGILLDGVELLLTRRPELRERLRIEFVGWMSEANLSLAARRLPALDPVVRHTGFVRRAEAIARQRGADAGLVLIAAGEGRDAVATGKLYEYLGLDLPVLAVVPPGEVRRILGELDWGVVADPTPRGVADGLARIMELPRPDRPADPERRYERAALTARLVELLDEVTAAQRKP